MASLEGLTCNPGSGLEARSGVPVCGGSAVFKSGVSRCCRERAITASKESDDELRGEDAIDVLVERAGHYVVAHKEEETEAQAQHEVGRPDVITAKRTNDVVRHTRFQERVSRVRSHDEDTTVPGTFLADNLLRLL